MISRTITIEANPPYQIVLYFDSRSNAEIDYMVAGNGQRFIEDDYKQSISISSRAVILSDQISDGLEMMRAQGEMEIVKAKAEMAFEERIEKDAQLKAFRLRKRSEQAMKNAQKLAMPAGIQQ